MSNEERTDVSNGIWLCRECAAIIDRDERKYSVELLRSWKSGHEEFIASGGGSSPAGREINVSDGGIGSIVQNTGNGIGLDVTRVGGGPAERITVKGSGVGEIITNTGAGIGKRVTSFGGSVASVSEVIVDRPVAIAAALSATLTFTACSRCGRTFSARKVIQGLAADSEPKVEVACPHCGAKMCI